jgi:hypothetical protein
MVTLPLSIDQSLLDITAWHGLRVRLATATRLQKTLVVVQPLAQKAVNRHLRSLNTSHCSGLSSLPTKYTPDYSTPHQSYVPAHTMDESISAQSFLANTWIHYHRGIILLCINVNLERSHSDCGLNKDPFDHEGIWRARFILSS